MNPMSCHREDKCIISANYNLFKNYTNSAVDSLLTNIPAFESLCKSLQRNRADIMTSHPDCSDQQLMTLQAFFAIAERQIMTACQERYLLLLRKIHMESADCHLPKASTCLTTFMAQIYASGVRETAQRQGNDLCAERGDVANCVRNVGLHCGAISRSLLSQALSYIDAITNNNDCRNKDLIPWMPLTETNPCQLSREFRTLADVMLTAVTSTAIVESDWKDICRNLTDVETLLRSDVAASPCNLGDRSRLNDTYQLLKQFSQRRCDEERLTKPQESPQCQRVESADCLSRQMERSRTALLDSSFNETDQCRLLLEAEACAKRHAAPCGDVTRDAVTRGVTVMRALHDTKTCGGYVSVAWPAKNQMMELLTTTMLLKEGEPPQPVHIMINQDPTKLCTASELEYGCQILLEMDISAAKSGEYTDQLRVVWDHDITNEKINCNKRICGRTINQTGKLSTWLVATLDALRQEPDEERWVTVRYKKIVRGDLKLENDIGRVHVTVLDGDRPDVCKSIIGPNLHTFDGRSYDNYNPGYQILYRNKRIQVHTAQTIHADQTLCTCAVAVQVGDDVLVLNRCNSAPSPKSCTDKMCPQTFYQSRITRTKLHKHGELTPGTKVFAYRKGQSYKIVTPTASIIDVNVASDCLSVYVYPSPLDVNKAEGLCGFYDANSDNDFRLRDGRQVDGTDAAKIKQFITSWVVDEEETIFHGVGEDPSPVIDWGTRYCTNEVKEPDWRVQIVCKDHVNNVQDVNWDGNFEDITSWLEQTSRSPEVVDGVVVPGPDQIWVDEHGMTAKVPSWNQSSITEDQARVHCRGRIELRPMEAQCNKVEGYKSADEIQACIDLIRLSRGGTAFTFDIVMGLDTSCITLIPVTPLNKTLEDEITLKIPKINCPSGCSDKGICNQGVCICAEGYSGDDCSLAENRNITLVPEPGGELCDIKKRDCSFVNVLTENFGDGKDLKCTVRDNESGELTTVAAVQLSRSWIVCPINRNGSSSVGVKSANGILNGTITTVVYDGNCYQRTRDGVVPKISRGHCLVDETCYAHGDVIRPCQVCDGVTSTIVRDDSAHNCSVVSAVASAFISGLPWWLLLLATFLTFMLLLLLLVVCCWCCCRPCKDGKCCGGACADCCCCEKRRYEDDDDGIIYTIDMSDKLALARHYDDYLTSSSSLQHLQIPHVIVPYSDYQSGLLRSKHEAVYEDATAPISMSYEESAQSFNHSRPEREVQSPIYADVKKVTYQGHSEAMNRENVRHLKSEMVAESSDSDSVVRQALKKRKITRYSRHFGPGRRTANVNLANANGETVDLKRHKVFKVENRSEMNGVRRQGAQKAKRLESSDDEALHRQRTTVLTRKVLLGALVSGRQLQENAERAQRAMKTTLRSTQQVALTDEVRQYSHDVHSMIDELRQRYNLQALDLPYSAYSDGRQNFQRSRSNHDMRHLYCSPTVDDYAPPAYMTRSNSARSLHEMKTAHNANFSFAANDGRGVRSYDLREGRSLPVKTTLYATKRNSRSAYDTVSDQDEAEVTIQFGEETNESDRGRSSGHAGFENNAFVASSSPGSLCSADEVYFVSRADMARLGLTDNQVTELVYETRDEIESDVAEDIFVEKSIL